MAETIKTLQMRQPPLIEQDNVSFDILEFKFSEDESNLETNYRILESLIDYLSESLIMTSSKLTKTNISGPFKKFYRKKTMENSFKT